MASVPRKNQPSMSSVIIALIYTRVSTEDQAREGVSLDAQLADCRKYAANHGFCQLSSATASPPFRTCYRRVWPRLRGS